MLDEAVVIYIYQQCKRDKILDEGGTKKKSVTVAQVKPFLLYLFVSSKGTVKCSEESEAFNSGYL